MKVTRMTITCDFPADADTLSGSILDFAETVRAALGLVDIHHYTLTTNIVNAPTTKAVNTIPSTPAPPVAYDKDGYVRASYVTDDRDRDEDTLSTLDILHAPNGDFYVGVRQQGLYPNMVRISTSGGASFAAPGLTTAIRNALYAMLAADKRPDAFRGRA